MADISPKFMYIELPLHSTDHRPYNDGVGSAIWIEFHAMDGSICTYETRVYELLEMPMKVLQVDSPEVVRVEREQRREFVRVSADLEVKIQVSQTGKPASTKVYTRDISGGGMSLLLPRAVTLHAGQEIHAQFQLPLKAGRVIEISTKCLVIRLSDRNDLGFASASLKFIGMKESVRQRIIQYTFMRQRFINNLT